jgi:hypothetical protein
MKWGATFYAALAILADLSMNFTKKKKNLASGYITVARRSNHALSL